MVQKDYRTIQKCTSGRTSVWRSQRLGKWSNLLTLRFLNLISLMILSLIATSYELQTSLILLLKLISVQNSIAF